MGARSRAHCENLLKRHDLVYEHTGYARYLFRTKYCVWDNCDYGVQWLAIEFDPLCTLRTQIVAEEQQLMRIRDDANGRRLALAVRGYKSE